MVARGQEIEAAVHDAIADARLPYMVMMARVLDGGGLGLMVHPNGLPNSAFPDIIRLLKDDFSDRIRTAAAGQQEALGVAEGTEEPPPVPAEEGGGS